MAFWRKQPDYDLPEDWEDQIAAHVVRWWDLPVEDRTIMRDITVRLLTEKRWEAAQGFELTEEMRLVISAQAALLVLRLGFEQYRKVRSIIVHPTTMILTGERASASAAGLATDEPVAILGEAAHADGPVTIAWDEVSRSARHPERGFNVVFHEFAHKLDMLDDVVDGTPPLATREEHDRWVEVCTKEYQLIQVGEGNRLLWDYAGVNPGEFFAVATEVFFDRPHAMKRHATDLYEVLSSYYRQDPAEWVASS